MWGVRQALAPRDSAIAAAYSSRPFRSDREKMGSEADIETRRKRLLYRSIYWATRRTTFSLANSRVTSPRSAPPSSTSTSAC